MQAGSPVDAVVPEPRRRYLSRDELRDVLTIALHAGQLMLENGANTARVEETVHRLGRALGAESMDILVTPQGIIATAVSHQEHRTRIQRVAKSGVDLSRVAAVIDVSRLAEQGEMTAASARAALARVARQPRLYGLGMTTIAVALGCAGFAVLFGGGLPEFAIVLLASGMSQYLRHVLLRYNLDRLLTTALVAAYASSAALVFSVWWAANSAGGIHTAIAVAAAVLLLVPGVPLVSGTADLFRGDIISGIARATFAFLVVLSIGVGIWATLLLTRLPVQIATASQPNLLLALAMALIAAGGFAVLFDVPYRALPYAALVGMLAVSVRSGAALLGLPAEAGPFLAGITIGALAELLARRSRLPTSMFSIPGYIPLVPGVPAFRAVLNFVGGDYVAGLSDVVRAMLIVIAIAIGLGTVNALTRIRPTQLP
jgi:uncharacterized membrane protein YjjP (DUF1212 family)